RRGLPRAFASRKLTNRRVALLVLAVLFTLSALLQYQFARFQLMQNLTAQLEAYARELRDELVITDTWDISSFRQATPAAPDFFIVAKDGLIVDVEGFVQGLLPRIIRAPGSIFDQASTVTASIGERGTLLWEQGLGGTRVD